MTNRRGVPATDVLPEYFPYRDNGCEVSPTCLACPLPRCKYDEPGLLTRLRKAARDRQVVQAYRHEGARPRELARRFRISTRTVHRILAREGARRNLGSDCSDHVPRNGLDNLGVV